MTHKAIHYSNHARQRLTERRITRQQVRWVLARGVRAESPTAAGAQRWSSRGVINSRELEVIFLEDADRIVVVTTLWSD
jgi:hypothetical protein